MPNYDLSSSKEDNVTTLGIDHSFSHSVYLILMSDVQPYKQSLDEVMSENVSKCFKSCAILILKEKPDQECFSM